MIKRSKKKIIIILLLFLTAICLVGLKYRKGIYNRLGITFIAEKEFKLIEKNRTHFTMLDGENYELINSAIKQDYDINFEGNIVNFDTLFIGKGTTKYLSSYIEINRDSIVFNKITNIKSVKAYKHHLKLKNRLNINIKRKVDSTFVTIINDRDTLSLFSDFVGMNSPFIRSSGTVINVDTFNFMHANYNSDIYVFGDSYVNCGTPRRWPYYLYNQGYKFLCDGLPGGRSIDSYDYLNSAFSVHKPKYVIWCLGMNDGSDTLEINKSWKHYVEKVKDLCASHNVTLVLSTIPSVPTKNHSFKNKFVRESGYRFIDFDKAVSNGKGIWKEGMLSDDGVHPTELGAKTLANAFLINFPEIGAY